MKVTKTGKFSFKLKDEDLKLVWISAAKSAYHRHHDELQDYERYLLEEAIASLSKCSKTITLRRSELAMLTRQLVLELIRPDTLMLLRHHLGNLQHQTLELPPPFT